MKFLSVLAADLQRLLNGFLVRAALAFASLLTGAVGLGFATCALFEAGRLQYGMIGASAGLALLYLVAAAVLYLCCRRIGRSPPPAPSASAPAPSADALGAAVHASGGPQAAAAAVGVELAKQMTPLQLAMLAAISGFIAGRRL